MESTGPYKELDVNGTLMWYYFICPREVWLIGRRISPDESNDNMELGRHISEHSYDREKRKEVSIGPAKADMLTVRNGRLVVVEIKKSSSYFESARMQLLLYLDILERYGIQAEGELRFPEEKKRERISLTDEGRVELDRARRDILRILYMPSPPAPKKVKWCKRCAYGEFCWA